MGLSGPLIGWFLPMHRCVKLNRDLYMLYIYIYIHTYTHFKNSYHGMDDEMTIAHIPWFDHGT